MAKKKQMIENKRIRAAIGRVIAAGIMAMVLLYISGISLITFLVGANTVEERADLTKSAMQSLTGQVLGVYHTEENGVFCALQGKDGVISAEFDSAPEVGETVTATGFVNVLTTEQRAALFEWYDENGDFSGGSEHFDNVSPMCIHSGYGRFLPMLPSKILIASAVLCGIYTVLIYMGISSGRYGENK